MQKRHHYHHWTKRHKGILQIYVHERTRVRACVRGGHFIKSCVSHNFIFQRGKCTSKQNEWKAHPINAIADLGHVDSQAI